MTGTETNLMIPANYEKAKTFLAATTFKIAAMSAMSLKIL